MKLLHTADWHLGAPMKTYGGDFLSRQWEQVERVLELVQMHQVDALLVAGDVFERGANLKEITKELASRLSPLVARGLHVILSPGNHDQREHFRMMHALLDLVGAEYVHITATTSVFEINGVQFAVLPYPTREVLMETGSHAADTATRNVNNSEQFGAIVRQVCSELDDTRPAVLVAHVNVAGVQTPSEHELGYAEDLRLGRQDLPLNVSYIALGHIHQQLRIEEHPIPCWYAGSIERMNWGEKSDQKGVLLAEIPPRGNAQVTQFPLPVLQFCDVQIDAEEIETLAEHIENNAVLRIKISHEKDADLLRLRRRVTEICGRYAEIDFDPRGGSAMHEPFAAGRDIETQVTDYLRLRFADDADLPLLEERATRLLAEVQKEAS